MKIRAAPPEHFRWMAERSGYALPNTARALEAVNSTGEVCAMVAFDAWTPNSAHAHVAADSPARLRALLREAAGYVFRHVGVLFAVIRESNVRCLRLAERLGFRVAYRLDDGWAPGEALVGLRLRREDYCWPKERMP